jgi:hypothetical protein
MQFGFCRSVSDRDWSASVLACSRTRIARGVASGTLALQSSTVLFSLRASFLFETLHSKINVVSALLRIRLLKGWLILASSQQLPKSYILLRCSLAPAGGMGVPPMKSRVRSAYYYFPQVNNLRYGVT